MKRILLNLISFALLTACTHQQLTGLPAPVTSEKPASNEVEKIEVAPRISLYWENTTAPHPERAPWSDLLISILRADLAQYEAAKDIAELCPAWKNLSTEGRLKALGELWVATAYYESGFNPQSNSVDVGTKDDLGSYSVGLFQMSANDSACKVYKANFETLKGPLMNIKCATEQMRRQLSKTGEILLHNSSPQRYWAVLLEGNKYTKIPEIKARVLKYAPICK